MGISVLSILKNDSVVVTARLDLYNKFIKNLFIYNDSVLEETGQLVSVNLKKLHLFFGYNSESFKEIKNLKDLLPNGLKQLHP